MVLNDVWRNINQEIGIFTRDTFDRVPVAPGTYGWFYPLRITTRKLDEFLDEVNVIMNFDAKAGGKPKHTLSVDFTWEHLKGEIERTPKIPAISESIYANWNNIVSDDHLFNELRKTVMRASIFMPPLYVGKARDLSNRCMQHVNGSDRNDFHNRYAKFARELGVFAKDVRDLLFVCVKTAETTEGSGESAENMESVVEEIMKYACKPAYSIK